MNTQSTSAAVFQSYLGSLVNGIRQEHGKHVGTLLSLNKAQSAIGPHIPLNQIKSVLHSANVSDPSWEEFVIRHVECVSLLQTGKSLQAYDKAVAGLIPFLKVFREDQGSWLVYPMQSVVHNLRDVADRADVDLKRQGKKPGKLVDCGDQLRKCFSVSLQAPGNKDKKMAALDIVNVSIKIYFKLNTLRLCKNLIRTVESRQFPPFDVFPVSQKVTYKFYLGRLAVFDEKYEDAQEALEYALLHCHKNARKNTSLILKYLIPVGLLLGRLPSLQLSRHHGEILAPYIPIAESLKSGNIGMFYQTMKKQRNILVKDGTYLLLEKLQAAVYRRLLKKVWIIHAQHDPAKAAQIPLVLFEKALKVAGVDIDMDEIECIAANLIARKYVKGYISHKLKVMVVHKTQPFPNLSSVILVDE